MRQFQSIPSDVSAVQEERNFSNPLVRFRKIRGRIVPIYNRKRIGQETRQISKKVIGAGVVLGAYGIAKAIATKRLPKFSSNVPLVKATNFFKGSTGYVSGKINMPRTKKAFGIAAKPAKFAFRNPLKVSAAAVTLGALGMNYGVALEASSPLGFDIGGE